MLDALFARIQDANPFLALVIVQCIYKYVKTEDFLSFCIHEFIKFHPILQKISVTASSPPSRYTDPKALVSRTFQVWKLRPFGWLLESDSFTWGNN